MVLRLKPTHLLAAAALLLLGGGGARAQSRNDFVIRSDSGQFIAHEFKPGGLQTRPAGGRGALVAGGKYFLLPPGAGNPTRGESALRLSAPLVAVACERVKRALLTTLALPDDWAGEIHVFLDPNLQAEQVGLNSIRIGRTWAFRLGLPLEMKETDLDRVILHAILLEKSNRNASAVANNIPNWLTEGLVRCLQARDSSFLSVQRLSFLEVRPSQAAAIKSKFTNQQPLTFDEMCWPENLDAGKKARFAPSAELFVYELLALKDGPASLGKMIRESARYLNWQFAFQNSFQSDFLRPVDVEKWWAVTWVRLLGEDASRVWGYTDIWDQLESSLRTTLVIQTNREARPARKTVTLQEAIRALPQASQTEPLGRAILQLREVRRHVPQLVGTLVFQYEQVLSNYLDKSARAGDSSWQKNQAPVNLTVLKHDTCSDLDTLDRNRVRLRINFRPATEKASLRR